MGADYVHELGIMYHIVQRVLGVVNDNGFTEVKAIVLSVGEQAGVVPDYLRACYPAAVSGTVLENTSLEVELVAANAVCRGCGKVFALTPNTGLCPRCQGADCEVVSGKEFIIKEIHAC